MGFPQPYKHGPDPSESQVKTWVDLYQVRSRIAGWASILGVGRERGGVPWKWKTMPGEELCATSGCEIPPHQWLKKMQATEGRGHPQTDRKGGIRDIPEKVGQHCGVGGLERGGPLQVEMMLGEQLCNLWI